MNNMGWRAIPLSSLTNLNSKYYENEFKTIQPLQPC
jgi:hypothetical protein